MRGNYVDGMSGLIDFRSWLNACYATSTPIEEVVQKIRDYLSGMTHIEAMNQIRVFCPEYPGMMSHQELRAVYPDEGLRRKVECSDPTDPNWSFGGAPDGGD